MLKAQTSQILNINLSQVKRLGIDEIALVKGQGNYLAVLVDLDTNKPIELVESRRVEDIRKILMGWGSQVHKNFRFWILDFGLRKREFCTISLTS
jgi:transposase